MNQEEDGLRKFKKAVFTMRAGQPLPFHAGESGEGGWVLSAWKEALILSVLIVSASQALLMKSPSLFWEQVWSDRKMKKPHFMQVKRLAHDLPAERKGSSAGSHPPAPLPASSQGPARSFLLPLPFAPLPDAEAPGAFGPCALVARGWGLWGEHQGGWVVVW